MSASPFASPGSRLATWRAWHPEAPFALIAAAAWLALALERPAGAGLAQPGWVCLIRVPGGATADLSGVVHTPLMLVATMVPVTMPWLGHVALNSPRSRQVRAMTLYLAAYLAMWLAIIAIPAALLSAARPVAASSERVVLGGALLVAAGWHLAPLRRRALADCVWVIPLRPAGRAADVDCLRLGLNETRRCVTTCWALMAVMLAAGTNLLLMAVAASISFASQWTATGWDRRTLIAACLGFAGLTTLLAG